MIIEERNIREKLKKSTIDTVKTYSAMQFYYRVYDYLHGTRHLEALHVIYECEQIYTLDGIALRCHTTKRTLDRNRKEYLECFMFCESMGAIFNEAAFAIASL